MQTLSVPARASRRPRAALALLAILLLSVLPGMGAAVDEPKKVGSVDEPGADDLPDEGGLPGDTYVCHPPSRLNLVDQTCSANDACDGAESWPVKTTGTSEGHVGGAHDPQDWSRVEVYRTETLTAGVTTGFAVEQAGTGCTPSDISLLYADQNGWYKLRVAADVAAPYTVTYDISANDALSGKDVGNTLGDAWLVNALPRSLDPSQQTFVYKGSLPNREDQIQGPDQDWYRIGSSLAAASDPTDAEGPAIGLLTIRFSPDCNGGEYAFSLYGPDGLTEVGTSLPGCGPSEKACVTTGLSPVHARFAVTSGRGTGYDFTADLVPLYLVDLDDGVQRPHLDPEQPWCEELVASVVEAAGWRSGAHVGFVDAAGVVVATARVS